MKVFEGWLYFSRKGLGVLHQHPIAPKTCARFMRAYINLLRPNIMTLMCVSGVIL